MVLSSGLGKGRELCGERAVVAQQGPKDVDAAACQRDHGLGVGMTVGARFLR